MENTLAPQHTQSDLLPLDEILSLHSQIISSTRMTLDRAIRVGELLAGLKRDLGHGNWLPWVAENLPFDERTARNYMRCWNNRDELKSENVSDLADAYRRMISGSESESAETEPDFWAAQSEQWHKADDAKPLGDPAAAPTVHQPESAPAVTETPQDVEVLTPPPESAPHVSHNSGENEWYTPPQYIEAARKTMGGIDLDPASCELANSVIQAGRYFTKEQNGLDKEWDGRVWMNPPYAQPLISEFSDKITSEFESNKVSEACILVNNATDTAWFHRMMEAASAVCFTRGRIRFIDKNGDPSGAPLQGQAIIYFGKNKAKFRANFEQFGFVL